MEIAATKRELLVAGQIAGSVRLSTPHQPRPSGQQHKLADLREDVERRNCWPSQEQQRFEHAAQEWRMVVSGVARDMEHKAICTVTSTEGILLNLVYTGHSAACST